MPTHKLLWIIPQGTDNEVPNLEQIDEQLRLVYAGIMRGVRNKRNNTKQIAVQLFGHTNEQTVRDTLAKLKCKVVDEEVRHSHQRVRHTVSSVIYVERKRRF